MASFSTELGFLLLGASMLFGQTLADKNGCADSKFLTRMPGCRISNCRVVEFGTEAIATESRRKLTNIDGQVEVVKYYCPATTTSVEVAGNAEQALKAAGYQIVFKDAYTTRNHWVTARNGAQWVSVVSGDRNYTVSAVKTKEMEQVMEASAASWAKQIQQTGRVSIYGINFETGKAIIRPDSEAVLNEVAGLLQQNPDWAMVVAGHTDNTGPDDINVPLSRQRAEAVTAALVMKGIDNARLTAAGFGSKRPLDDNSTEPGRAKNRRVDLIRMY